MDATTICNFALARIGEARITDIDTGTDAVSRACLLHFAITRDSVLRSHPWNFATQPVLLEWTDGDDTPAFDWDYQVELPADFLRVVECNYDGRQLPFRMQGNLLLTNSKKAEVWYVFRNEDCDTYDPIFIEALTLRLAEKLATSLRGSSAQVIDFGAEYERITAPLARRIDANEGERKMKPLRSKFIEARFIEFGGPQ